MSLSKPLSIYFDVYACNDQSAQQHLVLLHGWGMHSGVWDDLIPELLHHFTVTIIDLPGMGRSPVENQSYDLDYLTRKVLEVAPEKALWMGWSLGGMIALNIAHHHPERVDALINVASTPCFTQQDNWPYAMPQKIMKGFQNYFAEDWEGTLIRFLSLQCKDSTHVKAETRQLRELLFFHGLPATQALRGGLEILASIDLREALKQLSVPVIYIFGERDNLIPIAVAAQIKALNPIVEIAEIKGCSHLPFLTETELFLQAFREFLGALKS